MPPAPRRRRRGRPVPEGAERPGRRFVVETIDLPARPAYRDGGPGRRVAGTEAEWFAGDDPLPFFMMLARSTGPGARHLVRLHRDTRRATGTGAAAHHPLERRPR